MGNYLLTQRKHISTRDTRQDLFTVGLEDVISLGGGGLGSSTPVGSIEYDLRVIPGLRETPVSYVPTYSVRSMDFVIE